MAVPKVAVVQPTPIPSRGSAPVAELPFSLVPAEVFRSVGTAGRGDAEALAKTWLTTMVNGSGTFEWRERGSDAVVAEPDPELPCLVFAGAREFAGCWVPTLFLMAGQRETNRYWQWATCGARQAPRVGNEAIEGVEWVIDMLLSIVQSSIKSPAA